ncbi:hypothetical protein AURDEDRAFT_177488 [Auricularia subglabra TFB-10046 SS5]|uniref:Uncharacterized protein n=1 Tax=Auricularia subglabra (strain TFB-10046 / SS5) TaxID=717982 RepID=J0WNM3_AURST|nr:hypothetical protein AURDEDRAFT_177488 [Auricularia subglabra TFB-10046 SS5]
MSDTPSGRFALPTLSPELEEGEMEEELAGELATQSPLSSRQSMAPAPCGQLRSGLSAPSVKAGESARLVTSSTAWAVGTLTGGISRVPPTEPRALRHNNAGNTPGTPGSAQQRAPIRRSPGRNYDSARCEASTAEGARASKRRRRDHGPPVEVVSDPRDVELGRMHEIVRQKQQRIDNLQWELAEAQARLHIHRTRGPDQDFDYVLREKITKKYYKRNCPEDCKDNWRIQELSDISDEESVRDAPAALLTITPDLVARENALVPPVGEIHTPYDDDVDNVSFCLDDEQLAAADSDVVAGAAAQDHIVISELAAKAGGSDSDAARQLAREQLIAKTAVAEYGLRFNYVLLLWQENGAWLPAPVGRFGQPYWKGSSWEDFDPRRLFDKGRSDHVAPTSQQFLELAQDASLISFAFRSATQRQVVSLALQRGKDFINSNEPDIVSTCRINPARLPPAIRRHYRRGSTDSVFYAEYDAADLGNYIMASMSGPQKKQDGLPRGDYQEQKRAWLQQLEACVLDWLPGCAHHLPDPEQCAAEVQPWGTDVDLVNRRLGDNDLCAMIWRHLTANGLPRRSLLSGGDFYDYIRRGRVMEQERQNLSDIYDGRLAGEKRTNQELKRRWIADRLPYEPVPAGLPVVRVRLVKEKVDTLAQKYRERRNAKSFIPL